MTSKLKNLDVSVQNLEVMEVIWPTRQIKQKLNAKQDLLQGVTNAPPT